MKYALLTFAEYFKLNHDISISEGYNLDSANVTKRQYGMNPPVAEFNGEPKCVLAVDEKNNDLLTEVEQHDTYIPIESTVPVEGEIESDVIDWTFNHCEKQGVDTTNLVTFIASQDASNYPTIPSEGEWCEAKIYDYNGNKAKCLQPHTRMHYAPEDTPALWLIIETITEGYPEWVQQTGAHDAYMKGDKVKFNGNNYESLIDNNVWSPAVYPAGWKMI